jgi:hypothetical protein
MNLGELFNEYIIRDVNFNEVQLLKSMNGKHVKVYKYKQDYDIPKIIYQGRCLGKYIFNIETRGKHLIDTSLKDIHYFVNT